jgi:PAS domain S-box-containing protein
MTGFRGVALTLLFTGAAALASLLARPGIYATPYLVFSAAVLATVWFVSFRHSMITLFLGALFVNYYLRPPYGHFSLTVEELVRSLIWIGIGGFFTYMADRLQASESRARKVLAGIAEGFFILDNDWNVAYANDSAAELAGKPVKEITGENFWVLTPEARDTVVEQQFRRCSGESVRVQFESRSPYGSRWLQFRAYPFSEGISVFVQDITEAREREDKLRSSLERLAQAHKAAQMGTFEWSAKSNEIVWSDDTYRIHGVTREQFDGKFETWAKHIHPEDRPAVLAKMGKAVENKSEFLVEYREVWPNGETHWYGVHGQVMVDERGDATGMVGVCSDVTDRHLEEETLRRSEKLAVAGRLAATIAHEINNPLEAVTNLIYLLRQDRGKKSDAKEMLRLAEEELARVNQIAKQTLGFYRDRNVPEAIDVVQTLEELLAILRARIASKQISVVREYENACLLKGLRGELRQVFSNLLTNAIDASPTGGKLIVRVKPERSAERITSVHIEVEDFGGGISPANQKRIFEPFFTTKSDIGTGLGLWVTKELVEKHGGTIVFRNSQNGSSGTCFAVVLPGPGYSGRSASLAG